MNRILVSTWNNGLFELAESASHSFAGTSVGAVMRSRKGRVLGIVDRHTLVERIGPDDWRELASSPRSLSCAACADGDVFVGTDDAQVLKLGPTSELDPLDGFATVDGREDWYAGTAVIDGKTVGPPLGVRSMSVTSDEAALLVNVHVGGIPRSLDRGATWTPTIDVDSDVHEVSAHPDRPGDVLAAAAVGLCVSADGGATWRIETAGLHATYCSAARFCDDTIFVAASEHHFAPRGAIYRRPLAGRGALERVAGGLPDWLDGIVDTACIDTLGSTVVIADRGGHVYESADCGLSWTLRAEGLESPSAVVALPKH
jgi:hypothetical protein